MIFARDMVRQILAGAKTQTRRPVKPGKLPGTIAPCPYRPGASYAVQPGRGRREVARIEILTVHRDTLAAVDYHAARAEGFRTTADFQSGWVRLHDAAWLRRQTTPCPAGCDDGRLPPLPDGTPRWCPACDAAGEIPGDAPDHLLAGRFAARHADTRVWVLTFCLLDTPRLLAPAGDGSGDHYRVLPPEPGAKRGRVQVAEHPDDHDTDRGYTTSPGRAMRGECEAVDEATLDRFTADARERWAGLPGRRAEHARRLLRANHERAKRLLAAGEDPADLLALLEEQDRSLRLIESQGNTRGRAA